MLKIEFFKIANDLNLLTVLYFLLYLLAVLAFLYIISLRRRSTK